MTVRRHRRALARLVRVLGYGALLLLSGCSGEPGRLPDRPNVVLIETDDQRWDTLSAIPETVRRLGTEGVTFTQAVVSNPICCPSRASLLSGGYYSHNVGVLDVLGPNGGAPAFDDGETLPVQLQRAGYRTGFVGKYLNDYDRFAPRVPPGWDRFVSRLGPPNFHQHRLLRGESGPEGPGRGRIEERREYLTYLERDEALRFVLESSATGRPFFLWLATHAPHRPATPAPEDGSTFSDFRYRGRAWGERNVTDKPDFIQAMGLAFVDSDGGAKPMANRPGFPAGFPRLQMQSLRAVDRIVAEILDQLDALGLLDRTAVVFTSDNGFLWGEHRIHRKGLAYEESIRVPLLARVPGLPRGRRDHLVAIDLDLAPTILELAGLPAGGDGVSLVPALRDPDVVLRREVFLEGFGNLGSPPDFVPPWAAVRTDRFKYVEYADGQRELYDLEQDPFELENRYSDPALAAETARLARAIETRRGLSFQVLRLPEAQLGQPYRATLAAVGGRPPYTWTVVQGRLPAGLELSSAGVISGVPEEASTVPFLLQVTDRSSSPRDGRSQRFRRFTRIPTAGDDSAGGRAGG